MKDRSFKIVAVVALVMALSGLVIAYAAYSTTLKVSVLLLLNLVSKAGTFSSKTFQQVLRLDLLQLRQLQHYQQLKFLVLKLNSSLQEILLNILGMLLMLVN